MKSEIDANNIDEKFKYKGSKGIPLINQDRQKKKAVASSLGISNKKLLKIMKKFRRSPEKYKDFLDFHKKRIAENLKQ